MRSWTCRSLVAAWAVLAVASAGWAGAGEGPAAQGKPYAVIRPGENPLAKPDSKVPVPTIVWERVKVRPDHPRLLFNKDTKPALRRRYRFHPARPAVLADLGNDAPLACAFMYQMTGRASYAEKAMKILLGGGLRGLDAALVFDWTYEAMTEAQRGQAVELLWDIVPKDRATGWARCSPYTSYPADPRPSETPPDQWPAFYNWTFHDQDWARDMAGTLYLLIALAGHHPRAEEGVRNYWEYSLKDAALFLDYLRDGSYWQGYYWYVTGKVRHIERVFDVMRTACGIDYLDDGKHPYMGNLGRWLLYCCDTGDRRVLWTYGDGADSTAGRAHLMAANHRARDPYVQWLVDERCERPAQWLDEVLCYDPTLKPRGPSALPTARAFAGTGLAVMRSSWEPGCVWASVRWCDWFDAHVHGDVGSFLLDCGGPLVPDSGYYDAGYHLRNYAHRTVAHNTLTIRDPKRSAALDDGCQRMKEQRTWSFAVGRAAWVYHQDVHDRGDLLAFEHHDLYDYCAGDGTMAYSRELLKEFIRQAVFLRDGVFVVFDRVETTRPDVEKRWLLHLVGEPRIEGKLLKTHVKGHIEDYAGGPVHSRGRGAASVRCHTLLPAERVVRRVGGAIADIPTSALVRVPRSTHRMGTGSRWHWSEPLSLKYKDKLTGKALPAILFQTNTPTRVDYEISKDELTMRFDAYERGRVSEARIKLGEVPNLFALAHALHKTTLWHVTVHYLPGYEWYSAGVNYAPSLGRMETDVGGTTAAAAAAPKSHGSWRIEVYPAKPAVRNYFLHVLQALPGKDAELASVRASETPDRAEATIVLGKRVYTLSFDKTGPVGGRMRITSAGGDVLANRAFTGEIVQTPWPSE